MITAPTYTIAEYAAVEGITPRAFRKACGKSIAVAAREKEQGGRMVASYRPDALPLQIRQRLARRATRSRYRDVDDMLAKLSERWQPEIAVIHLPPETIEKAARKREVFAPILRAAGDSASISQLVQTAQQAFARANGYELRDDRSVRRWIERAKKRDRGREEWNRVELYLEDRLARRTNHTAVSQATDQASHLEYLDVRSTVILGWVLHSENNYNARIIRSLITRCHDSHGLPGRGFYFERNIWQRAKLLKGNQGNFVPLQETELGLREFCEFRHALLPRAKPIERVFGLVQNQMEKLPGYVGRDERKDRYERTEKQKLAVLAGRIHPREAFYEKSDLIARYAAIFEKYNATPQQGKRLAGATPAEIYETRDVEQTVWLGGPALYLLKNHRMLLKVSKNGLRLPVSMGGGVYRIEQTGSMIGSRVLVWVDVDNLDYVSVTDVDRKNSFVVGRADALPAMDATPEEIAAAQASRRAHGAYTRSLYRVIAPVFSGITGRCWPIERLWSWGKTLTARQRNTAKTLWTSSARDGRPLTICGELVCGCPKLTILRSSKAGAASPL